MLYIEYNRLICLVCFTLRQCELDNGYIDGRSQISLHTDERTHVHSARFSPVVTHSSTS